MNRELYRLIKALRRLSADDIARVHTFINQLRATNLRGVPAELKAVPSALAQAHPQPHAALTTEVDGTIAARLPVAVEAAANEPVAAGQVVTDQAAPVTADAGSTEASPLAHWRRRAFQGVTEADLQPIAALVREARENRAMTRQKYGAV